jgi:PEGA domain
MQSHDVDDRLRDRPGRLTSLATALCVLAAIGGCVQRRLTIRSNPPGARVYVGDEEIGTTPVSTDFVYYGTRKIRLVKDGYETMVVNQPIPAPWYQIPPLDFVSENLVPGEIRDERVVNFQLAPLQPVLTDQFLARAEQLRASGAPPTSMIAPAVVSPGISLPAPGVSVPAEVLPEPTTSPPAVVPPQAPFVAPPGSGAVPAPPANAPVVPTVPPPYNPPQYLPSG